MRGATGGKGVAPPPPTPPPPPRSRSHSKEVESDASLGRLFPDCLYTSEASCVEERGRECEGGITEGRVREGDRRIGRSRRRRKKSE